MIPQLKWLKIWASGIGMGYFLHGFVMSIKSPQHEYVSGLNSAMFFLFFAFLIRSMPNALNPYK